MLYVPQQRRASLPPGQVQDQVLRRLRTRRLQMRIRNILIIRSRCLRNQNRLDPSITERFQLLYVLFQDRMVPIP